MKSLAALIVACGLLAVAPLGGAQKPAKVPLGVLLDRVGSYLTGYAKAYASVVAEERYTQNSRAKRATTLGGLSITGRRELKSDMVAIADSDQRWLSFRDVFSVDGNPVRDRDQRLQTLFLQPQSDPLIKARAIGDEGARFNLGTIARNVNFPTMALTFLVTGNQSRSKFRLGGDSKVNKVETIELSFEEVDRPTIVRSGTADLPVAGRFWIEPETGRVMKSSVRFESREFAGEVNVTFDYVAKVKLWVPVEMDDTCSSPVETVSGRASYTNFRQFGVSTDVVIK